MAAPVATPAFTGKVSKKWRKLFAKLPKFDIYRDAGGCWFDEETAEYVIVFVETRLHYMEGEKMGELIVLEDWQKAIFGAIFGWKRIADNLRRFRFVWFLIPRKNTKTMMLAIMAIIMLVLEGEGGAQNILAGADEEQAANIFKMTREMINQDEDLERMVRVFAHSMTCDSNVLKIISANYKAKHGKNINFAAIDEVHEHPSADMVNALITSSIARRQPLFVEATTADEEGESYCNDRHEYAKSVRDGIIRVPNFLPIIYELTDPKRWKSEKAWAEVNPNLGVSIKIEAMRELCLKAQQMPSFKYEFCRLHLNMKVQAANKWIDLNDWDACAGFNPEEAEMYRRDTIQDKAAAANMWRGRMLDRLRGQRCWGGLDLSSVSDLTSELLLFEGEAAGYPDSLVLIPWCWCPGDAIEKKGEEYRESYRQWTNDGFLVATPGDVIDFKSMRAVVAANHALYPLVSLGIDTKFQGVETAISLQENEGIKVEAFGQGFKDMAAPMIEFEMLLRSKRLVHGGNPLFRWQIGNVIALSDGTAKRPVKEGKNSPKKIDTPVAALMALGMYSTREKDNPVSRYNNPAERLFAV